MSKVLIVGGPRTGKTTLSLDVRFKGVPPHHCDEVKHLPWSEQSDFISKEWLTKSGPWVIEGATAVRALRKWVKAHPQESMEDWEIYFIKSPKTEITPQQQNMTSGILTIWNEIAPVCNMRGAKIVYID